MPIIHKYQLPSFLSGIVTVSDYDKWLNCKADSLRKRDLKRERPFAATCSKSVYKQKIHAAILDNGTNDPFTGDALRWDLIGAWDNKKEALFSSRPAGDVFNKEYFLLPTVDHSDPYSDELKFEICSWIVNSSKTLMNPEEYVGLCRKVAGNK